ncbi:hypothetical protein K493DRAFT_320255 [Basidiobolus meristosporus CBS 931.73]|uniref:Ras-GEF domain-containing protein n=1 Tax=Basidiobolus meristosporus CBS 931.73 TaxID=1314790 RepID=A0A1Y1XCK2_9FUNG|nr:hypothetical protein K493DRAFT_320255 [Basidiobolus meristosporus CBS 931.73]|eukprot:ORX83455.1 hypothetical protein K493DRAFT_320255 [Basidiobolus meristosporus CBS 931.73]
MEEVQQLLKRAEACQGDGVFGDAYFMYLNVLEVATKQLRSVVFDREVVIKKPRQINLLFASCQRSLSEAQTIVQTHSMNIETQSLADQSTHQPEQAVPNEVEFRYQTSAPRKRMVATKPLKRLAIVHDHFQPIAGGSHDWSFEDSEPSTSPENEMFNGISPPTSPHLNTFSPPDSPNYHSHQSTTLSIPNTMILPQQTYIHIVPEGSVDPLNLVPAQMGDDEVSKGQYVPVIPKSPLLISYHTLSEKLEAVNSEMVLLHNVCRKNSVHTPRSARKEDPAVIEKAQSLNLTITETQSTLGKINNLVQLAAASTHITTFSPRLVAYQLTLIESALFQRIPPTAVLTHSPKSPHPAIVASTDFFNYLTRVVETSILLSDEPSDRAEILNHWIRTASRLHDLRNFQTLKAVLSATGTPPVQRLKRTWNCVPKRAMSRLDTLRELMSEDNNYGKYREIMIGGDVLSDVNATTNILPLTKPTVPFLGVFIMDATYLLAATKKSGPGPGPSPLAPTPTPMSPATPLASMLDKGKTATSNRLEDDPRIQTLLSVLRCYLAGPRYPSTPPQDFLKSKSKLFTFSTSTSTSTNTNTSAENPGRPSTYEKQAHNRRRNKELDGLYTTQQVVLHYLLSQPWCTERQVDEISNTGNRLALSTSASTSTSTSTSTPVTTTVTSSNHSSVVDEASWSKHNNSGIREAFGSLKHHLHFHIGHSPGRHEEEDHRLGPRKPSLPNLQRIRHALGTPPAEEGMNYELSFATMEISPPIPLARGMRTTSSLRVPRSTKSAESLPVVTTGRFARGSINPTIQEESYSLPNENVLASTEELVDLFHPHLEEREHLRRNQTESSPTCTSPTPTPTPTKLGGSNLFTKKLKPLTRTIRNITS